MPGANPNPLLNDRWAKIIGGTLTGPLKASAGTVNQATGTDIVLPSQQATFAVQEYSARGLTDDQAVAAALADRATAGGGRLLFPSRTFVLNNQIIFPYGTNIPPVSFEGSGDYSTFPAAPAGGTILDLRYAGPGPKIACWGAGFVGLERLHLQDNGASTNPYIQLGFTTLHADKVTFWGNPTKTGRTCDQTAIVAGGFTNLISNVALTSNVVTITTTAAHGLFVGEPVIVTATTNSAVNGTYVVASVPTTTTFTYALTHANIPSAADTGTAFDGFQGYGVNVENTTFRRMRTAVRFQSFANSLTFQDSLVWVDCGAADATHAAIEVNSSATANVFNNVLIEMSNYPVGVLVDNSNDNCFDRVHFWDTAQAVTQWCFKLTGTTTFTNILPGKCNLDAGVGYLTGGAATTLLSGSGAAGANQNKLANKVVFKDAWQVDTTNTVTAPIPTFSTVDPGATDMHVLWQYPASQSSHQMQLDVATSGRSTAWDWSGIGGLSSNDFAIYSAGTGSLKFLPGGVERFRFYAGGWGALNTTDVLAGWLACPPSAAYPAMIARGFSGQSVDIFQVRQSDNSVTASFAPSLATLNTPLYASAENRVFVDSTHYSRRRRVTGSNADTLSNVISRTVSLAGSLNFNGTTQYGTMSALGLGGNIVSISAWIKPATNAALQSFVGFGNFQVLLNYPAAGNLSVFDGATVRLTTTAPPAGSWSHVGIVEDSTHVYLYVGGTLANSAAWSPVLSDANWGIGRDQPQSLYFYQGAMADVAVWNTALSAGQWASIASGSTLPATGLIGHWLLNDGAGSTAVDSSGGGHNVTLIGSPTWNTSEVVASLVETTYLSSQDGGIVGEAGVLNIGDMSGRVVIGGLLTVNGTGIGAFGASPVARPTVTGSRGANAALASFLTAMANLGWITDSSS